MRIYLVHTHTKRDATASGRTRAIFLSYLNALFRMRIRVNVAIELLGFIVHVRHGALVRSRLLVFDITGITTTGCFLDCGIWHRHRRLELSLQQR